MKIVLLIITYVLPPQKCVIWMRVEVPAAGIVLMIAMKVLE